MYADYDDYYGCDDDDNWVDADYTDDANAYGYDCIDNADNNAYIMFLWW